MPGWADKLLIAMMEGLVIVADREIMEDPETVETEIVETEIVEADQMTDAAAVQEMAAGHRAEAAVDLLLWILNKGVKLPPWEAELLMAEEEEMVTVTTTDVEVRGMVVPLTLLTHAQVSTAVATEEALPLWILNKGEK